MTHQEQAKRDERRQTTPSIGTPRIIMTKEGVEVSARLNNLSDLELLVRMLTNSKWLFEEYGPMDTGGDSEQETPSEPAQ